MLYSLFFILIIVFNINLPGVYANGFYLKAGYAIPYRSERIGNHEEYRSGLALGLASSFSLLLEGRYYQYKYYWNRRDFEYRGTIYTSRNAQLWRDHGLSVGLVVHPFKRFYTGLIPGVNRIYVWRIVYEYLFSFWVNSQDQVYEIGRKEEKETKLSFSIGVVTGWEQPLWRKLSLLFEGRYDILFVDRDFAGTNSANLRSLSIWIGLKYKY